MSCQTSRGSQCGQAGAGRGSAGKEAAPCPVLSVRSPPGSRRPPLSGRARAHQAQLRLPACTSHRAVWLLLSAAAPSSCVLPPGATPGAQDGVLLLGTTHRRWLCSDPFLWGERRVGTSWWGGHVLVGVGTSWWGGGSCSCPREGPSRCHLLPQPSGRWRKPGLWSTRWLAGPWWRPWWCPPRRPRGSSSLAKGTLSTSQVSPSACPSSLSAKSTQQGGEGLAPVGPQSWAQVPGRRTRGRGRPPGCPGPAQGAHTRWLAESPGRSQRADGEPHPGSSTCPGSPGDPPSRLRVGACADLCPAQFQSVPTRPAWRNQAAGGLCVGVTCAPPDGPQDFPCHALGNSGNCQRVPGALRGGSERDPLLTGPLFAAERIRGSPEVTCVFLNVEKLAPPTKVPRSGVPSPRTVCAWQRRTVPASRGPLLRPAAAVAGPSVPSPAHFPCPERAGGRLGRAGAGPLHRRPAHLPLPRAHQGGPAAGGAGRDPPAQVPRPPGPRGRPEVLPFQI